MDQIHKYLAILRIEIDDLGEDIAALEERTRGRAEKGEITEYVLRENVAVLERERHGIVRVRSCLAEIQAADYASLHQLLASLRARLDDSVRCGEFDPGLRRLVDRKLQKVASYVQHLPAPPA